MARPAAWHDTRVQLVHSGYLQQPTCVTSAPNTGVTLTHLVQGHQQLRGAKHGRAAVRRAMRQPRVQLAQGGSIQGQQAGQQSQELALGHGDDSGQQVL